MAKVSVKWNSAAVRDLERKATSALQDQANAAVQQIIREVDRSMKGEPADAVEAELVRRLKATGVTPNSGRVREFAVAISEGTLS